MTAVRLKKLIRKEAGNVLRGLIEALNVPIGIQDLKGTLLLGDDCEQDSEKYPIMLGEDQLGWVVGGTKAASVAALLTYLAERELEKRSLTNETLERYKEVNLLYTFSAKMAACLDHQAIAKLVIEEARKFIKASSGSVMLFNQESRQLEIIAASGTAISARIKLKPEQGIAGSVFSSGKGVIINDVLQSEEFVQGNNEISSIICVPLKVEEKIIGVMNISSQQPALYTAGDLKLATALATQAAVAIENARLHIEHLEREKILQELEIARNIQQSLLPNHTPAVEGAEVAAFSLPAKQVGGDFYDFIPVSRNRLGLVIADVSGKGVPAALFMALSRALMRANSLKDPRVSNSVVQTNRLILECATSGLFVTLFYAIVNAETRLLRYVSAGHNPPLLYHKHNGTIQTLEADGIALGVIDEIELEEKKLVMDTGDVIVLYTDGVTEAINEEKEEFGEERLQKLVSQHHPLSATELITRIKKEVLLFTGNEPQFDDFTLMVVKIT